MSEKIPVQIIKTHPEAIIPTYAHDGDAGFDLYTLEDVIIKAGKTKVLKTGISMAIPNGYEIQIRPRSGVSLNGLTLSNADNSMVVKAYIRVQLGTIDCQYRGDIGIIALNSSEYDVIIPKKTKLAQGVLNRVPQAKFIEVDKLDETDRGNSGFGSSGL